MIIVDIAPGPAIKGIAKGTTAISFTFILFFCASFNSLFVFFAFGVFAFIMFIDINSNKIPPAILKEEIEIPKINKKYCPIQIETNPAIQAAIEAVLAVSLFSLGLLCDVKETKIGMATKGENIDIKPIDI